MVRATPLGKLQETWAVFLANVIFLLFLVGSTDLDADFVVVCSPTKSNFSVKNPSFRLGLTKNEWNA